MTGLPQQQQEVLRSTIAERTEKMKTGFRKTQVALCPNQRNMLPIYCIETNIHSLQIRFHNSRMTSQHVKTL